MQEKGIDEAFWPLYELDEQPEKGKGSHWVVRTGMALTLAGVVWALHVYVPDKAGGHPAACPACCVHLGTGQCGTCLQYLACLPQGQTSCKLLDGPNKDRCSP